MRDLNSLHLFILITFKYNLNGSIFILKRMKIIINPKMLIEQIIKVIN